MKYSSKAAAAVVAAVTGAVFVVGLN